MKALVFHGKEDVRIDNVPDPVIQDAGDVILKVTRTAICGSDLHLYANFVPEMKKGDILGHEFMGEVVEVGKGVTRLKKGDRVVTPFVLGCGHCNFCETDQWSMCDNTNPDHEKVEILQGQSGAGLFGFSHLYGGYAGGQAEYARVPFADFGPIKIPEKFTDEQVLFLSDIFPTGWQAAENCNIKPGDTIAIWGCGPVGQMAIRSAYLLGAKRVIAIDRVPSRLAMAVAGGAEVINMETTAVPEALDEMTKGRGPDSVIDAVGFEAHGLGAVDAVIDNVKHAMKLTMDRAHVLREAIYCCRKGGTVSLPGVYIGFIDKMPMGAAFGKGLTFKMGQTHVQKYLEPLLELIDSGKIDPSFVITHRLKLSEAPEAYKTFRDKKDGCVKVVMTP